MSENTKVYIHEYIDIIGHNRANYMHHMTANWSPVAQERNQLCYGVWGVVGSTRRWPEVINLWEEDGWEGLSSSFGLELNNPTLQNPSLEKWWARAANFRRAGFDRILVPAPWTMTIEQLCAAGIRGETYAHEQVAVKPGTAWEFIELVRTKQIPLMERYGWTLIGAWVTAMRNDSEVFLLWAIPSWDTWSRFEAAVWTDQAIIEWRNTASTIAIDWERCLVVDSPLAPMRTGRQPRTSDQDSFQLPD